MNVLVVHGGAGDLKSEEDSAAYRAGVAEALEVGFARIGEGVAAAAVAAVVHMESHTIMNAGRGAALDSAGGAALDAGFMEGATRRYGAVTGVRNCENPILLAERLSAEGDFGSFVGPPDADGLADEFGIPTCSQADLVSARARRMWEARRGTAQKHLDTVGAVALDGDGRLVAAVSTGGMSLKRPGRIGDSPVVGGGFWADDEVGACVSTGYGEVLMRQGIARRCVQLVGDGRAPADAAAEALAELFDFEGDRRGASGLILLTRDGVAVLDHNSNEMSGGWMRDDGSSEVHHLWRNR